MAKFIPIKEDFLQKIKQFNFNSIKLKLTQHNRKIPNPIRRPDLVYSKPVSRYPKRPFQSPSSKDNYNKDQFRNDSSDEKKKILGLNFFKSKKFQYLLLPLIILSALGFYGYYSYAYASGSKFTATIKYKYININQTKNITISKTDENNDIKIVELSVENSTATFVDTTGEKPKGDKASGEITIFNPTTSIKEIPAGTSLACISSVCNGLGYITQGTLNVGPGSSEIVKVEAGDIGSEYNLAAGGGKFQVSSFDPNTELVAQNIKPISGGTKKEIIKTVAAEDIAKAEEQAMNQLKTSLLSKLKNDPANKNYSIAESSFSIEKIESKPDHAEGEESNILNTTLKAKGKVNAFAKDQINIISDKMKKELTPQDYSLDEALTKVSSSIVNQTADSIEISVTLTSVARPNIDVEKIKKDLAGKHYSQSEDVLKSIPHTTGFSKEYYPQTLPQYFWDIPEGTNRISIKLVSEGASN